MYPYLESVHISTNFSVPFLCVGNSVETGKNVDTGAANCAPCANSILTLEEQIFMLDNMVLEEGNESDSPPTDDEKSLD